MGVLVILLSDWIAHALELEGVFSSFGLLPESVETNKSPLPREPIKI